MSKVLIPRSLEQLWQLQAENKDNAVFAGGTDLLVKIRAGKPAPKALICLDRLDELKTITELPSEIALGAAVTPAQVLASPLIKNHFPVLNEALRHLGSPHIRNMGSLGGNIMTASPAGDSLPPLYVLQAAVELQSAAGTRKLQLKDFIRGPGQTQILQGEILSRIIIPKEPVFSHHFFEKVGLRQALAIAVVSLAALYNLDSKQTVSAIRLAWGSLGPTVVVQPEVEQFLLGKPLTTTRLTAAADLLKQRIEPISDIRAGADYRRRVAGNLLKRLNPNER